MAKNYDEGLYFIGCESDGKVRLTEDGRRILNTNKKAIKGTKLLNLFINKESCQK